MIEACNSDTTRALQQMVGERLEAVSARRYPTYLAYFTLIATFSNKGSFLIELEERNIADMFEVYVIKARPLDDTTRKDLNQDDKWKWDHIQFSDFVVSRIFILRRKEWLQEVVDADNVETVGENPLDHKFGSMDDGDVPGSATVVDSGIVLLATSTARLSLEADTFPLVFQLRYDFVPSPVPKSSMIPLEGC